MYLDQKPPKRLQLRRKTIIGEQLYWLRSNMWILANYSLYYHFWDTLYGQNTLWISLSMYLEQKAPKRLQLRRKTITGEHFYWFRSTQHSKNALRGPPLPNWENKICSSITFFVAFKNGLFMYWEAQKCLDGGGTVKKILRLCTRTVWLMIWEVGIILVKRRMGRSKSNFCSKK